MKTPPDLKARLLEFEEALDGNRSRIHLAADFARIREEIDLAFSPIGAEPHAGVTKEDRIAVDSTTRWP
jgi:hypothetical protein